MVAATPPAAISGISEARAVSASSPKRRNGGVPRLAASASSTAMDCLSRVSSVSRQLLGDPDKLFGFYTSHRVLIRDKRLGALPLPPPPMHARRDGV